mmetsp:Transcript_65108/g.187342  ORF Transcript_65108/g.187342 Transcript_65108/m.187342 type:complete len:232 (-) Transcript_65108:1299-1994(-)
MRDGVQRHPAYAPRQFRSALPALHSRVHLEVAGRVARVARGRSAGRCHAAERIEETCQLPVDGQPIPAQRERGGRLAARQAECPHEVAYGVRTGFAISNLRQHRAHYVRHVVQQHWPWLLRVLGLLLVADLPHDDVGSRRALAALGRPVRLARRARVCWRRGRRTGADLRGSDRPHRAHRPGGHGQLREDHQGSCGVVGEADLGHARRRRERGIQPRGVDQGQDGAHRRRC